MVPRLSKAVVPLMFVFVVEIVAEDFRERSLKVKGSEVRKRSEVGEIETEEVWGEPGKVRRVRFRGKERSYIVEMIEEGDYGERGVLTRALGLEGKEGKKGKEKKRGRVQEMRDFEGLMKSMEGGEVKPMKKKKKKKEKEGR